MTKIVDTELNSFIKEMNIGVGTLEDKVGSELLSTSEENQNAVQVATVEGVA